MLPQKYIWICKRRPINVNIVILWYLIFCQKIWIPDPLAALLIPIPRLVIPDPGPVIPDPTPFFAFDPWSHIPRYDPA